MKKLDPFNIGLFFAEDRQVRGLRPTTKTDIYDGITNNFDDQGLFSTLTFGRVGTPRRDNAFSYINLHADVIHPAIYNVLKKIKRLYIGIINGTEYAVWNNETKDFEPSDMINGDTGMAFFTRYLHRLDPAKNNSKKRNLYVDVFKKYQRECLMHNCIVIPAGLRDLYLDAEGREVQDEINEFYRKLITIGNNINVVGGNNNSSAVDVPRRNLQNTMVDIYTYLSTMLEGKKGLIQAKWGGRKIAQGTRNVLSSMEMLAGDLRGPRAPTVNDVQIGLLQTMVAALPLVVNKLKTRFLNDVFVSPNHPIELIDPKTKQLTSIRIDSKTWDKWSTVEGLNKLILRFQDDRNRNQPIKIEGHYLYWVYNKDDTFKVYRDINLLPEDRYEDIITHSHPMTYSELFYLCNYEGWYNLVGFVTRYPIAGMFSIFPGEIYTRTTSNASAKYELDDNWERTINYAKEYPDLSLNANWINTAIVSSVHLASLGADYDGDTVSVTIALSKNAQDEIKRFIHSRKYIVGANGKFNFSANTNIPRRVMLAFTGDPK